MSRGSAPPSSERAALKPIEPDADELTADVGEGDPADLTSLPIAGLTRARLVLIAAVFAAVWIGLAFSRQLSAAGELGERADGLRSGNVTLEARVAQLQAELELVQRPEYISIQARAYRLGSPAEIPFALDPNAPPLPADAPGSAAVRLGAEAAPPEALEAWLTLLFEPAD